MEQRVKTLKIEEERAAKKVETAKKNIIHHENIRKDILINKIHQEEVKNKRENEIENQKKKIEEQHLKTQSFLKNWKSDLAIKNHENKMKLKKEQMKLAFEGHLEQRQGVLNHKFCKKV